MYDKVELIGNLTRDPEMQHTQSGTEVTNLNIATNRKWTDKAGQKQEQVVWWRVSVWGKQAEACEQYLSKGRQVFVEGQVTPDENGNPRMFERNDGTFGTSFELRANRVLFLGSKGERVDAGSVNSREDLPF